MFFCLKMAFAILDNPNTIFNLIYMNEVAFAILLVLFVFIGIPIILIVKIGRLKEEVHSLSMQLSTFSQKMENLVNEILTNQEDEILRRNRTSSSPVADSILTQETLSTELGTEEPDIEEEPELTLSEREDITPIPEIPQVSAVKNEEVPSSISEEILSPETSVIEEEEIDIPEEAVAWLAKQEKEEQRYAAEQKAAEEEILFFDIQQQPAQTETPTPQKKENTFLNQFWGENLLSKIGIITFVLGIAFFVKYAIDKDWINEIGRVGIGLLTGAAIIGVGHKLRKQYDVFSSILAGGGFAVFYITITLAFREYELIPQPMAFLLLILVTIACVVLSVFYDKKELALFALLGGFAAPFLVSTGSGNYVVLFGYILILNTGMLWLAYRKNWNAIGVTTFALTQLVIWSWLLSSFSNQYGGVFLFLLLFFAQFHILAITDHLKKGGKMIPLQAIIILVNNLSLFVGGMYIFMDHATQLNGLITIGLALLNAIALITIFRNKEIDKSFIYLLIATILTFITIAIPIQMEGKVITLLWAAETVILLVLWIRSRMDIFRIGLYVVIALVICSYVLDIEKGYEFYMHAAVLPLFINWYFITGISVVIAFGAAAWLLKKESDKQPSTPENKTYLRQVQSLFYFFYPAVYVFLFIVLYVELDYQLGHRIDYAGGNDYRLTSLLTYVSLFAAATVFLNRKRLSNFNFAPALLLSLTGAYAIAYFFLVNELREAAYYLGEIPTSYFYIHLASLLPVGYLIYQIWQYCTGKEAVWRTKYVWMLVVVSVVIITQETDSLAVMISGNQTNYFAVLRAVHTFGYPILWGILAMCLMVWGLKTKDILLRKISLVFFAFIIGKFYLYDVWQMTQGGRIISFVVLGLILLLVSFMQQRIRKLVKEEDENQKSDNL